MSGAFQPGPKVETSSNSGGSQLILEASSGSVTAREPRKEGSSELTVSLFHFVRVLRSGRGLDAVHLESHLTEASQSRARAMVSVSSRSCQSGFETAMTI
jgi:GMP synthase-like glutamine amidotransferase